MKMLFNYAAAITLVLSTVNTQAQKIKITEGDLSALAGQTTVNIDFTYDNMSVGKFKKEQDYIDDRVVAYNKKEPGVGDTWATHWVDDRQSRFEPKFIELFEKYSDLKVSSKKDAKYTLIVHTVSTEPGFNVGIMRKNSEIDLEVLLVETADKSKVMAKLVANNIPGRSFGGYDFDTGLRIMESYEMGGKAIGKFIRDKIK